MPTTAGAERAYYDRIYSQFLGLPDADLVCNRRVLEGDLDDPGKPVYERRRLYRAVLRVLLSEPVEGRSVLDYGCGTGDWGLMLATEGAEVTSLDLSEAAVRLVLRRAAASGAAARVRGVSRDATDLSCFGDGQFDLIYASAAIHHTLKYGDALAELIRVLRGGGRLVIAETFGNNRLLNFARRARWVLAREPVEAGEDLFFGDQHVRALRAHLDPVEVMPVSLFAMAKRLFRGHFRSPAVRRAVGYLGWVDEVSLRLAPGLGRYCGEVVVVARKPAEGR